jgi:hypothetical protein
MWLAAIGLGWRGADCSWQRKSTAWYTLGTFEHQYGNNAAGPWLQGRTNWRHGVRWRYHGIAADGRCKSCRPTAFRRVRPPEER